MKFKLLIKIILLSFLFQTGIAQQPHSGKNHFENKSHKKGIVKYGIASYYADKFNVRKTSSGEKYNHLKFTAACNVLPLNTLIKVTNLSNGRSVVLRINDRLNRKNKRLIDVSKSAAKKLGFLSKGITKVKVETIIRKGKI